MKKAVMFLLSMFLSTSATAGQAPRTLDLQAAFDAKSAWRATLDAPSSEVPIDLCFSAPGKTSECHKNLGGDAPFAPWLENIVDDVQVLEKPGVLMVKTTHSNFGSDVLTRLQFWRYDMEADRFISAGVMQISIQGEYRLDGTMLYVADARWGKGETHFAPHYYAIDGYAYREGQGFLKRFSYQTSRKYPSLDAVDRIDVISHEMPDIKQATRRH